MKVKSIPTTYGGIEYRSRTEARWAVFFSENRIPFRYEAEGFDMGGVRYLPDFWLSEGKCWFEVKPYDPSESELDKALRLARATRRLVFIAPGNPAREIGLHVVSPTGNQQSNWHFAYAHEEGVGYLCDCLWCAKHEIRIAAVTNPAGMYGCGPDDLLEEAGNYQFSVSFGERSRANGRGRLISRPEGRRI